MAGSTSSALSTFCSSASPTISSTCRGATPMRKPAVRASSAALPETRREFDDPVVAVGVKIAAVIAALDRNENKPGVTERDRLALADYLSALEAMGMSQ